MLIRIGRHQVVKLSIFWKVIYKRHKCSTDFRKTVHYHPMPGVSKEVVYFLTETTQSDIQPRQGEIAQVEWVPLEQAEQSLTHENDKTVLRAAMQRLREGKLSHKK